MAKRSSRSKRQIRASVRLAVRPSGAADALDVSRSRIYELMNAGLPSVKIGGLRLIRVAAIERLLKNA